MKVDLEQLVDAYLKVRTEREKILREYEVADAALKTDLAELEKLMLEVCNDVNANSIKTNHGTIMRRVNERFFCSDWSNFHKFVKEHDAVELLEKRIHQGNFKQFLEAHEGDGLPPGVNVMREYGISVRKNTK